MSGQDLRILLRLPDAMDDHFDRRISGQEFLRLSALARTPSPRQPRAIIANRVVHARAETVGRLADGRDRLGP